jgi:hypothetical protein
MDCFKKDVLVEKLKDVPWNCLKSRVHCMLPKAAAQPHPLWEHASSADGCVQDGTDDVVPVTL